MGNGHVTMTSRVHPGHAVQLARADANLFISASRRRSQLPGSSIILSEDYLHVFVTPPIPPIIFGKVAVAAKNNVKTHFKAHNLIDPQ